MKGESNLKKMNALLTKNRLNISKKFLSKKQLKKSQNFLI